MFRLTEQFRVHAINCRFPQQTQARRAEVDRLRRRYLRQADAIGARPDGTIQELADEAFADVLKKHGIPIDLKDALRRSATRANNKSSGIRKARS
jgi:hypothetical protein